MSFLGSKNSYIFNSWHIFCTVLELCYASCTQKMSAKSRLWPYLNEQIQVVVRIPGYNYNKLLYSKKPITERLTQVFSCNNRLQFSGGCAKAKYIIWYADRRDEMTNVQTSILGKLFWFQGLRLTRLFVGLCRCWDGHTWYVDSIQNRALHSLKLA